MAAGLALIASSLGLARLRLPNWQSDGELLETPKREIERWGKIQRIVRKLNNGLLALIGAAIFLSSVVPRGRLWMLMWSAILLLLMICVMLAMVDAFSSLASYRRALPEAARRSLGSEQQGPAS